MFAMQWSAIFLAAFVTLLGNFWFLSLALLLTAYGVALLHGQLSIAAAIPIILLLLAATAVTEQRPRPWQYFGHALFIGLALALSLHLFPGFHNPKVFGPERITADAAPFTMYLNLDKPLVGFWLVLLFPWIRSLRDLRTTLIAGVSTTLITTVACMALAIALGVVAWEPKFPAVSWLWALNNLLLVSFAEEAFFRGYLQGGISRMLKQYPYKDALAIGVAAFLFGLSHATGGWQLVALASLAGVGYGLAYRFGGFQVAVLSHFGLNATHFFLFTYPALQPI
ncbi:CAAX amino terminal protease family [Herbaspirillum sp. CF444]|uniref:CPBP family intramembrane glutamic endopeptidase n=1 Tax=Herbaspirillum sp. CF444 TaxID=1144319 RepID=UPI0002724669|nr:CPBP family intramembrane glutamic endopeptidase [Herbaspirillum sp. CF444]EJL83522.1 CAAX amino terminal protease family [Herbaspirillum sp. CF444]